MASYILPGLYLGSWRDATNKEWLKQTGISVVVSALTRGEFRDYMLPLDLEAQDIYHIEVDDAHEEVIHTHFRSVHRILQEAHKEGKQVLVHCAGGVSRSPTLVIAYLMLEKGWPFQEALTYVLMRREVDPNDGFRQQLEDFSAALTK
jgi:protein-tyrosine phosphatase